MTLRDFISRMIVAEPISVFDENCNNIKVLCAGDKDVLNGVLSIWLDREIDMWRINTDEEYDYHVAVFLAP